MADRDEIVDWIAEAIEQVTDGDIARDQVRAGSPLWTGPDSIASLGLTSVDFFVVLFWVEKRAGTSLPDNVDPITVQTIGELADRFLQS